MNFIFVIPTLQSVKAFFIPLAAELAKRGNDVSVLTDTSSDQDYFLWEEEIPESVNIIHAPIPRIPHPIKIKAVQKTLLGICEGQSKTIIHGHFLIGSLIVSGLSESSHYIKVCTLHSLVENDFGFIKRLIIQQLENRIAKLADRLWVLNDTDFKTFKKYKSVQRFPGYGMGINQFRFSKLEELRDRRNSLRSELKIAPEALAFIYIGRLIKGKGMDELLEGFDLARKANKNLVLLICGEADPAYHSNSYQFPEGVKFMGWQTDLNPFLAIADVYLTASYREGMSIAVMEALYCGLPVLAPPTKGIVELVEHEVNGYIMQNISALEIAKGIAFFVEHKNQIATYSENAKKNRDQFLRTHAVELHIKEYQKLYLDN